MCAVMTQSRFGTMRDTPIHEVRKVTLPSRLRALHMLFFTAKGLWASGSHTSAHCAHCPRRSSRGRAPGAHPGSEGGFVCQTEGRCTRPLAVGWLASARLL